MKFKFCSGHLFLFFAHQELPTTERRKKRGGKRASPSDGGATAPRCSNVLSRDRVCHCLSGLEIRTQEATLLYWYLPILHVGSSTSLPIRHRQRGRSRLLGLDGRRHFPRISRRTRQLRLSPYQWRQCSPCREARSHARLVRGSSFESYRGHAIEPSRFHPTAFIARWQAPLQRCILVCGCLRARRSHVEHFFFV